MLLEKSGEEFLKDNRLFLWWRSVLLLVKVCNDCQEPLFSDYVLSNIFVVTLADIFTKFVKVIRKLGSIVLRYNDSFLQVFSLLVPLIRCDHNSSLLPEIDYIVP